MKLILLSTIVLICLVAGTSMSAVPQFINFQGKLLDSTGAPVSDGAHLLKFIIWDDQTATNASNIKWNSNFQTVNVSDGLFEYQLGSIAPFPEKLFSNDTILYLGVTEGTNPEMSPRSKLVSVGYAFHALRADTAGFANLADEAALALSIVDNSITGIEVVDGSIGSADINTSQVQQRVTGTAAAGQAIQAINSDGSVTAIAVGTGDITGVTASKGLTGGGITGEVTLAVDSGAINSLHLTDGSIGSVDINTEQVQQRVKGTAAAGQAIQAINSDGSVSAIAVGTGDITGVTAGSGLSGGGVSGAVTLDVATGGITSSHIANSTITNSEISSGAAIAVSKISGTAINLSSTQTITGSKTFTNLTKIGDSTFRANNNGIRIGDTTNPSSTYLVRLERNYSTTSTRYGSFNRLTNTTNGSLYGFYSSIGFTTDAGGLRVGYYANVQNLSTSTAFQYAFRGLAGSSGKSAGISYGVYGSASAGSGSISYSIYGAEGFGSGTRYAGYFEGNTHVTGTLSKGGGSFKIDHPLDPENKYLQHSFVESPDMMNVYNGNVTLDADGEAVVTLPDYFEVLNRDFRYQLTAIGAPGPNLYIAEKISSNQFSIVGGDPYSEVSWMVTGVRQDKWAEANRIQVELDKPLKEQGLYMHYEEYGFGIERSIHKEQLQQDRLEQELNESNNAFEE